MLNLDLSGRAALVTGGSRGIGKAICLLLAEAGADVMVGAGSREQNAREVAQSIESLGQKAGYVIGDLSDPGVADSYVEACHSRLGHLDILVNNAGIWEEVAIEDLTPEILERTLGINLKSVFYLCRYAAPLLRSSAAGRIINVSSTASLMGEPLHSPYAASKGALDSLTRSLAVELGPEGITVNSIAPGWTRTEMTDADLQSELGKKLISEIPLRKVATPEDVALAVAYLASDWAGHINGITLPVEGGYRIRR